MDMIKINEDLHKAYLKIYQMDIEDDENLFLKSGDSVLHMAFASLVRDTFNVVLTMEEYESNTSIQKLAVLISDKLYNSKEESN